jgi:broad-specificity NMP kinase
MLVWINGTFGVGKTTTGNLVVAETEWRLFDPEHVGYLLAANLKDLQFDDFQDLPPWRTLVPVVADQIRRLTGCAAMVAVQTVLVEDYWNELRHGLADHDLPVFHVVLDCDETELRRRIDSDEVESQAREWRLEHIEKFQSARPWLTQSADLVIDTTGLTPEAVARRVVDAALRPAG